MRSILLATICALGLAACEIPVSSGSGDGRNRVMNIVNDTNRTMVRFYASNSSRSSWGPDQLGSSVLGPHRFTTINFDDGTGACVFDFRAEMSNGQNLNHYNINVCVQSEFRVR